jgi:hypothetical protein
MTSHASSNRSLRSAGLPSSMSSASFQTPSRSSQVVFVLGRRWLRLA